MFPLIVRFIPSELVQGFSAVQAKSNFADPRLKAKYWRFGGWRGAFPLSNWAKVIMVTGAVAGTERETGTRKVLLNLVVQSRIICS